MTTIPCPQSLPWCTDHASADDYHRHELSHKPVVEVSQGDDDRVQISLSIDTDSDDVVGVRRLGQLIVAAADLVEAIEQAEYAQTRLEALTAKVWERKAGVVTEATSFH